MRRVVFCGCLMDVSEGGKFVSTAEVWVVGPRACFVPADTCGIDGKWETRDTFLTVSLQWLVVALLNGEWTRGERVAHQCVQVLDLTKYFF